MELKKNDINNCLVERKNPGLPQITWSHPLQMVEMMDWVGEGV